MKIKLIIPLIVAATATISGVAQPVRLHITGEVDTTNHYTSLAILRQNDSFRDIKIELPVTNGKVDYVFETSEPDRFELIATGDLYSKGSWMPMDFMAENGDMHFTSQLDDGLLRMTIDNASGPINRRHIAYLEHVNSTYQPRRDSIIALMNRVPYEETLSADGKACMEDLQAVYALMKEHPDSADLEEKRNQLFDMCKKMEAERTMHTPEYYALYDAHLSVLHEQFEDDFQTFGSSDGGIYGLSLFIVYLNRPETKSEDKEKIISSYLDYYKATYANTIIGKRMDQLITGYELSHVGGRYPDYSLPDADGNEHRIKDLIAGKLTLIDLWGSTCGPCRVNSKSMKPVYEDYKNKGFQIIGIAREYGDLTMFRKAVEKDGYPWKQLIELDDANGIYNMHGIPNAMGGTYLVSPEGRILLINPTPDELRAFLAEKFDK